MSDGRSEDRDQTGGTSERKAPAASDLLALWVTGKTSEEETTDTADQPAPDADDVPEEEAYAESLWPGDEPPAAGTSPEPVGGEQWWPYAEPEGSSGPTAEADPVAPAPGTEPAPEPRSEDAPASLGPRSQDMTTTASWTLDDFERYIRSQKDNELADWIGGERSASAAATEPAEQPDDPFSPALADAPAAPVGLAPVPDDSVDPDETVDPDAVDTLDETEVEWNPPEGEAPVAEPEPSAEPDPEPWAGWPHDEEPEAATQDPAPAPETDPGQAPLFEDPAPEAEDVWPEPELRPAPEPAPEPEPEPEPEPAPEPQRYDLQDWYDDYGLRWVSGDGGYTWYSDDGQGWDAEHSEVIPVPAGFVPFPGDPRSPGYTAAAEPDALEQEHEDASPAATVADPTRVPEVDEQTDEPADELADEAREADGAQDPDGWPSSGAGSTAHHYAGLAEDDRWPGETGRQPRVDPEGSTQVMSAVTTPPEAPAPAEDAAPAEPASYPLYADQTASPRRRGARAAEDADPEPHDEASFPEHVEYKPRGAYRPLLILLFVGAAVVAVAAILWAVSKGNQAVWGIAAAITGFTLFFWWGLLSWTPTLVSIDGPMLEVSRGSEGERFDLRSPRLDIRVDDDVYSRGWRTTIVRPNGTELVIPSSAVDAEEFSRIVAHHRAGVGREDAGRG